MIQTANLPNAYKEVYTILQYMDEEDVKQIPEYFIDMIKTSMNNEYNFKLNPDVEFERQELLRETKAIFAYIFLNFWANEKQKKAIKLQFNKDIAKDEEEKQKKYSESEIFNSNKKKKL